MSYYLTVIISLNSKFRALIRFAIGAIFGFKTPVIESTNYKDAVDAHPNLIVADEDVEYVDTGIPTIIIGEDKQNPTVIGYVPKPLKLRQLCQPAIDAYDRFFKKKT